MHVFSKLWQRPKCVGGSGLTAPDKAAGMIVMLAGFQIIDPGAFIKPRFDEVLK